MIARLGQPKVEDLYRSIGQEHDVARLQVPMDDSCCVCASQPLSELPRDLEDIANSNCSIPSHPSLERFALIQRHGKEEPAIFARADVMDATEVWMVERSDQMRLTEEARFGARIEAVGGQQKFEGDRPAEARVFGSIDDAYTSGSDSVANLEVRDSSP